jgi:amidase
VLHGPCLPDTALFEVGFTAIFIIRDVGFLANHPTSAILQVNPDAFSIAQKLDLERAAGIVRSPLHGIPFIVKDNIASKDRMETTAGSWALLGNVVPRDSFVVHRLRKAGALLLGKAALSEWADMRSNNYSEGFSARGGQCRSAYNFTVNPGGSSTGSGVAVGANLVPFALGTETDGSGMYTSSKHQSQTTG